MPEPVDIPSIIEAETESVRQQSALIEELAAIPVGDLSEWEAGFVPDVIARFRGRRDLTPRQVRAAARIIAFRRLEPEGESASS